ncbi:chaperone modulator CbpM [Rhodopila sp.]|uniref:chaperone modulator CbpM n=1 Tax=Rhodopila sp. TaxID=2480087 RepID=UPI003D0CC63D
MMRLTAVVALFPDLREPEVATWVERGWVRPAQSGLGQEGEEWVFQDIDIARVRLIRDLRHAMAVQEETIPLVLSLLDQVYALRGQMRAVARAVEAQDEAVRTAILEALRG